MSSFLKTLGALWQRDEADPAKTPDPAGRDQTAAMTGARTAEAEAALAAAAPQTAPAAPEAEAAPEPEPAPVDETPAPAEEAAAPEAPPSAPAEAFDAPPAEDGAAAQDDPHADAAPAAPPADPTDGAPAAAGTAPATVQEAPEAAPDLPVEAAAEAPRDAEIQPPVQNDPAAQEPMSAARTPTDDAAQTRPNDSKEHPMSTDITGLTQISGFLGGCLVDSETGLMLGSVGGGRIDLEAAAAANTEVVRAKLRAMSALGLNDAIEDILITLTSQYHLIRPLAANPAVFLYVALDKSGSNLGMARLQTRTVEGTLSI